MSETTNNVVTEEEDEYYRAYVDLKDQDDQHKLEKDSAGCIENVVKSEEEKLKHLEYIRSNVIGDCEEFNGPFGTKPIVYGDWTASGRAFKPIEDYIMNKVYPFYANTHTSTSITGLQSTCFRNDARQIIQQCVNGNTRTDVVLFTGSGATSAVNKLVHILGLKIPLGTEESRPVVFVGPFEHHSNLLPWRESNADVIIVKENKNGTQLDLEELEKLLIKYKNRPLRIGSFSAASNITGVLEDVNKVSALLHRHGALACWDYACAAPYETIDMNPVLSGDDPDRAFVHKDAVFISPHKFLGGVNTPGILVAKKRLLSNPIPAENSVGGGTVYFVKEKTHRYLSNRIEREEGGTPDVVGAIRAGLTFQLKQSIGIETIREFEEKWLAKVDSVLCKNKKIVLFGPDYSNSSNNNRLPIISFLIRYGQDKKEGLFLHYNFVAALLNDVFGIQVRGGCMCAGVYSQNLLGISQETIDGTPIVDLLEQELVSDPKHSEYIRPGFTRVSLAYFAHEKQIDYILNAINLVAEHGWRLLPLYRFNTRTGEWKHKSRYTKFPNRIWLDDVDFLGKNEQQQQQQQQQQQSSNTMKNEIIDYEKLLEEGKSILLDPKLTKSEKLGDQKKLFSETAAKLRWFVMPSEVLEELKNNNVVDDELNSNNKRTAIIDPHAYWKHLNNNNSVETKIEEPKLKKLKTQQEENNISNNNNNLSVICKDNSCFRPRKKDKFPVRSGESFRLENNKDSVYSQEDNTPQQESSSSSSSSDKVGATSSPMVDDDSPPPPSSSSSPTNKQVKNLIGQFEMENAKLFPKIPKDILKNVGKAIGEWDMIKEGDKILLGLSGGKDSLALLHVLLHLQKRAPVNFTIGCCTIDPMTEAFDPSPLIPYLKALKVEYHYVQVPIFEQAKSGALQGTSICSFCARMKRGALYGCAREHGYNVLALAQHLDDLAETTFMGLFHNGHVRSMMAHYEEKNGLRIIRPLVYVREHECKAFSYTAKLPVINENCPACFEAPQERKRMKKLLAKEEAISPHLFFNLRRAIMPLMDPKVLDHLESSRTEREEKNRTRKPKHGKPGFK